MDDITLVIPAKNESESLPLVLDELLKYKIKKVIVIPAEDKKTREAIEKFNCKVLSQEGKGFGNALIQGINSVETKYFCIFNADGSFNPNELNQMINKIENDKNDIVFASRYEENCSSEDDTIITYLGNFIFTKLGNLFFKLNISDILYTFVLGKTLEVKKLNLKNKNFVFCVELPIKAKRYGLKISTSKSHERARIAGLKKVNAIKDGFLILVGMIKLFFFK